METGRSKVLYLMSIPWGWIKQRPHFLAEGLSDYYDVDVFYKKPTRINSKNLLTKLPDHNNHLVIKSFGQIPFHAIPIFKYLRLEWINKLIFFLKLPSLKSYDYIWIPTPRLFNVIEPFLKPNHKIVYDCMDDMAEIGIYAIDKRARERFLVDERRLLQRAKYAFFSASHLREIVLKRAHMEDRESFIVNNAIEIPNRNQTSLPEEVLVKLNQLKNTAKPLLYIGTIAEWFDFNTVISALNKDNDLHLVLIGPTSNITIPTHPQISYLGTIKRDYIFSFMEHAYALVMPFVVNELIKSVNPVKLYEYIYTGKPVLAPRYEETEYFREFVFLYNNSEEFIDAVNQAGQVKRNADYERKCAQFLQNNTWSCRCKDIKDYLQIHE